MLLTRGSHGSHGSRELFADIKLYKFFVALAINLKNTEKNSVVEHTLDLTDIHAI